MSRGRFVHLSDYFIDGPIIKHLFAKTGIKYKRNIQIDYRLGVIINSKFVDIANIEVGKKPTDLKIKEDHVKLILEAKSIVSRIISQFQFISPPSIEVSSLQICGFKGDLLQSTMQFVTQRSVDRIRLPLSTNNSQVMASFLQRLLLFREKVLSAASDIKDQVNDAIDRRSSLSPQLERNLPNYRSWLNNH
ncbi:hypothetical protein V8B55DRAFT_1568739 [Mucor lusitanicus]